MYFYKDEFEEADPDLVNQWDFKDQCPLLDSREQVEDIFGCCEFWSWLSFMPNAYEILERLNKEHNLIIISIGTYKNISRKARWIDLNLPFIHDCLLINNGDCHMDKSIVDMIGGVLIDDVAANLWSSNADYKICFGKVYDWNKDLPNNTVRANDWIEVEKYINMITQKESLIER